MGCVPSNPSTCSKYKSKVDFYNDAADWTVYRYNTEIKSVTHFFSKSETFSSCNEAKCETAHA